MLADKVVVERDGFRLTTESWSEATTTSDGDGRFVLYPPTADAGSHASGLFVLRAEAPGHALTELGPRAFDARQGEELELCLLQGGAIEGRARAASGLDPTGLLLAFHRGDGKILTRRIGPDGHYRIDGLTSGPWEVRVLDDELHGQRSSSSSSYHEDGAPPFDAWSCTVVEGETTRHDVDLGAFAPCGLRGSLSLAGRALERWSATLERDGDEVVASVPLDVRGGFELVAPRGGRYPWCCADRKRATDASSWPSSSSSNPARASGRWPCVRVRCAAAAPSAAARASASTPTRHGRDGHSLAGSVRLAPTDGSFELSTLPEGPGEIARNDPPGAGQEFAPWEVVVEFELAPGAVQRPAHSP